MPAAAVIPAPVAYLKVVAVKKLVVGLLQIFLPSFTSLEFLLLTSRITSCKSVFCCDLVYPSLGWTSLDQLFYFEKNSVLKAGVLP